jgi:hypothetical protein
MFKIRKSLNLQSLIGLNNKGLLFKVVEYLGQAGEVVGAEDVFAREAVDTSADELCDDLGSQ